MKKNKKIIIYLLIFFIVVLLGIIVFSLIKTNTNKEEPLTEARAKELVSNSYIYYVLSSGNVPLNGKETYLDKDRYYGVDVKIKTLDELNALLKDTFSEITYNTMLDNMFSNPEVKYTEGNDSIYISKVTIDENCKDVKADGDVGIVNEQGKVFVSYTSKDGSSGDQKEVLYENGKWVLVDPITFCSTPPEETTEQ